MSIEGKQERQPSLVIEDAQVADAGEIGELLRETWLATYPNEGAGISREDIEERVNRTYGPETRERREERIRDKIEGEWFLVAKRDGKIVGVCRGARAGTERPHITQLMNTLDGLYVLPEYQKTGVGRELWTRAYAQMDRTKDTALTVADYNENAKAFYRTLGFTEGELLPERLRFKLKSGAFIPERMMILPASSATIEAS